MTALLRFSCLLFTCLLWQISTAQPLDDHRFHGCRYAKNKYQLPHLDDAGRSVVCGSNARSDSLDILNYAITLDLTTWGTLTATCEISFTAKQNGIEALPLDLGGSTAPNNLMFVDSVRWQGNLLVFDYDHQLLNVHLPAPVNVGDTMEVIVHYHGKPGADASGFGGFVFENNIGYNLGIGLSSVPYNFGRSWHPCFDNFVERATYDINILSNGGRKGYAIGNFLGQIDLGGGSILRQYRMAQPLPTYLVGSATSAYVEIHQTHLGAYGERPILLVCKQAESANMTETFTNLGDAIDALEAWYNPYIWGQVGYVSTTAGAMEHSTLIAFPDFVIPNGQTFANDRLMAHELAHHWWGNITTLSCPSDMWIKEGNAEYGAHLFTEFSKGRQAFDDQVKENHNYVLGSAHKEDDGYWPLSGIPYEHTYGTHTYNKGASVMHNLRGYLGDSLFTKGMRAILQDFQYQSVDAELFRDKLTAETGVDMNPYFNAWIFNPGFALFELDSVHYSPSGNGWAATIFVQQKLHHAPYFHEQVPLEITF
ncbi:MAG: M1 family aminopeptidase, partial [Bacteroidota bacterium]